MLNRRILRIKAFKELFAFSQNRSMTLKEALAEFERSCEAVRDLYLFLLGLVPALTAEVLRRQEAARGKFNPTEEERNPNRKFPENALSALLADDPDFTKLLERRHLSWDNCDAFLGKLCDALLSKEYYQAYQAAPSRSLAEDAALFARFFEDELEDNEDLERILEDLSVYWVDDLDYALITLSQSLSRVGRTRRWTLPPLYRSEELEAGGKHVDSDHLFATRLLQGAVGGFDRYEGMIAASAAGWEKDRICTADRCLIVLGLAEIEHVPEVPVRVSINEYVEIAKYFSTPRSGSFVNGLLDRLAQQLMADGTVSKSFS